MATVTKTKVVTTEAPKGNQVFLFDRSNFMWMIGGVALMLLGLILMAGGKSADPHQFNYDELYSFRRITLAPILMVAGMIMEVYAIMKKPASKEVVVYTEEATL